MLPANTVFFKDVLQNFLNTTRRLHYDNSLFLELNNITIEKTGTYSVEGENHESKRNGRLIKQINGITYSATSVPCRYSVTEKLSIPQIYDSNINHPILKIISSLLLVPTSSISLSKLQEDVYFLEVDMPETHITPELDLTLVITEMLNLVCMPDTPLISIDRLQYPVVCFGSFRLIVEKAQVVNVKIFNKYETLCGRLDGIKYCQSIKNDENEDGITHTKHIFTETANSEKEITSFKDNITNQCDLALDSQHNHSETSENEPADKKDTVIRCLRMLGIDYEKFDRDQTFLMMGLDSLKTAELEFLIQEEYPQFKIPPGTILKCPTINRMEAYLLACAVQFSSIDDNKEIKPYEVLNNMGLSSQQQRLIFMNEFESDGRSQYNEPVVFRMKQALFDRKKFCTALHTVIMQHSILRTRYSLTKQWLLSGTEVYFTCSHSVIDPISFVREPIDILNEIGLRVGILNTNSDVIISLLFHHISVDGHSIGIIMNDIYAIYSGTQNMLNSSLQYYDYINSTYNQNYKKKLRYWSEILGGKEYELIPTDKPRSLKQTFCGSSIQKQIPDFVFNCLCTIRQKIQCSDFIIFTALYKFLVYKTFGLTEFPIGFPYSLRTITTMKTVGCFVNVVPMINKIKSSDTIMDYFRSVDNSISDAKRYGDVPFEVLVNELKLEKDTSISPQFQVMLVMDHLNTKNITNEIQIIELPSTTSKYEQIWYFQNSGKTITIKIEFNTSLFDEDTIVELLNRFIYTIVLFSRSPVSNSLSDLSVTKKNELKIIFNNKAKHRCNIPTSTIVQILQENRNSLGKISCKTGTLSYEELNTKSTQLAHQIVNIYTFHYGELPTRDRCAAIFLQRDCDLILTIMATWKSGLIAVPIGTDWPEDRIAMTAKMFENPIFLHRSSLSVRKLTEKCKFSVLDINDIFYSTEPKWFNLTGPLDLMYITCTSGTTGVPKAVCTEFSGHSNLGVAYTQNFFLNSRSRVYQVVNYGFDIFFADIVKTIINGASIVLASELIPNINEMIGVSNAYIMPSYLSSLQVSDIKKLGFLESIQFGGESIQDSSLEELIKCRISLFQEYGLTEQTVYTTCLRMKHGTDVGQLGRPYKNLHFILRDSDHQILPFKYRGILYLGGHGLTRGYYAMSELNSKIMLNNEFGKEFCTGDNVKCGRGNIYFVGRKDLQVKIRGKRIELLEVQHHITSYANILACVVSVCTINSTRELVAYVKFKKLSSDNISYLKTFLAERVPSYFVPKYIIEVDNFPLNTNGKVDFSKLPKPIIVDGKIPMKPAETLIEKEICQVFFKYIKRNIMANQCFFDAGGDSLKAMLVIQELAVLGYQLHLKEFFSLRTAEKIAQALERNKKKIINITDKITTNLNIGPRLLKHQQKRIWLLEKMETSHDSYMIKLKINMKGHIEITRLQRALNHIIVGNLALRSIIEIVGGEPHWVTLSATESYYQLSENVIYDPKIDDRKPLITVSGVHSGERYELMLSIHHAICDGRSLTIIGKQLADAYNENNAVFSNEIWDRSCSKNAETFWEKYLEDYTISSPTIDENLSQVKNEAGYIEVNIAFISKNDLSEFTKKYNCSLFHVLVATYVHTYRTINDQSDVVIGTTVANRDHENIDVVGMYANTIPLRFSKEFYSIEETVKYTTEQILSAMEYQNSSLTNIIEKVVKHRDSVSTPIFHHVINLLNTSTDQLPVMNGLSTKITTLKAKYAQFHQSWIFSETSTGIALMLEYNKSRYSKHHVYKYIYFFKRIFYNMVKKKVMDSSRTALNISSNDIPHSTDIGTLFALQTKQTPQNIMLESTSIQLTYTDGYYQATARARYIRDKILEHYGETLRPDDVICIVLEEGVDNHIFIEAVHLLGCAYLSISPVNPIERIRSIIVDSGAKLYITSQINEEIPLPVLTCDQDYKILREITIRRYAVDYNISYLIYTSGTTGNPNGVCISHESVINMLEDATRTYKFRSKGRILQFTKSSFDASISNTFGALLNGGTIILSNMNEDLIENIVGRQPLSVVHMTPVLLDMLKDDDIRCCSEVEIWSYGGESISQSTMNRMLYNGKRLIQLYGPTETTCYITSLYMKRGHLNNCLGPIISNLSFGLCSFVDEKLQRQHIGQLYCSGANVARGYMGNQTKSLRLFPNNPYKTKEDIVLNRRNKIYLVGDRVRVSESNYLHFLGRKDNQVKVKGNRIELEEIEAIICKIPGVENCAAVIQKDKVQANHIVLFYTGGDSEMVKKEVKIKLPSYMVPTKIIQINKFPTTINGKINRRVLSLRDDLISDRVKYQPLTRVQFELLEIFREHLSDENIDLNSNFFQYGGHSLLAVRLAHIMSDKFSIDIAPTKLFEFPTVKELALWVENQNSSVTQRQRKIKSEEITIYEQPNPLQITLLRAFKNKSTQKMYNIDINIDVSSDIPPSRMLEIVNTIVMIHPSLRTAFTKKKRDYRAEIWSGTESYHTLEYCENPNMNAFEKPVFYAGLKGRRFHINVNHILVDGHSMNLISKEIDMLLNNATTNIEVDNYFHFNLWISTKMDIEKEVNVNYWKEKLCCYVYNQLRTDYPRTNISDHSSRTINFEIKGLVGTLDHLAKLNRCSPFVIAITAMAKALRIHSIDPSQTFGVGFPFNVRNEDLNNTVAYGINSLMVVDSGSGVYPDDLQAISGQVTGAMTHALITLEDMQAASPSGRLFNVMLTFDNYSIYATDNFNVMQDNDSTTKFEISIFIDPTLDDIKLTYMDSLYCESTIKNIMKTFNGQLRKISSGSKQIYVPEKNESVVVVNNIIYDVSDIIKVLTNLALEDIKYHIVNNNAIEISYAAKTNMDALIINALQVLPTPLRTTNLIHKQTNTTSPREYYPLSPQQQQMYYLSHVNSPSSYTLPFIKEFPKSIKPTHLQHSLLYIVQRHQSLRTMFLETEGEPRQVVLSMTEAYIHLNIFRTDDVTLALKNFLKQPVLLENGPPIRGTLIEEKEKIIALLQLHHIISDAWSTGIIENEMNQFLEQLIKGFQPELSIVNYHYADYCAEMTDNPIKEDDTDYLKSLALTPVLRFSDTFAEVVTTKFEVPSMIIERGSKYFRTSPFVIIAKALSDSLMEHFEVPSINIGLPFSNRCIKTKNIVGYFLNNLVLHFNKTTEPTSECLRQLQGNINERMKQNIPFYKLVCMVRKWTQKFSELFYVYLNCRYDLESNEPQYNNYTSIIDIKTEFPIEVDVDKFLSEFIITLRTSALSTEDGKLLTDTFHKSLISIVTGSVRIYNQNPSNDPTLQEIINVASNVLKTKSINENDNFFSVGGNSLQAIEFSELLEEYFNKDIDVSEIYEMDSFLSLAQKIEKFHDISADINTNNYETKKREEIEDDLNKMDEVRYTNNYMNCESLLRNSSRKSADIPSYSLPSLLYSCLEKANNTVMKSPAHLDITSKEANIEMIRKAHSLRNEYAAINGELIRPDTIIPVISRNSIETISNCLSVIMSGGTYLPIDSTNPVERIQFILKECNAACYIGQKFTGIDHKPINLVQTTCSPLIFSNINIPKDLAYVIYTSGTTGNPKGVCTTQQGVVNMMATSTYDFRITSFDVIYQFTNFTFDNSVLEIFMAFANGACLLLDSSPFSPKRFLKQISEYGISHCLLFPGIISTFKRESFLKLRELRYWIVGAEKFPLNQFNMAIEYGINVIQNYGPTELTAYALTKHMKMGDNPQNLGKTILNSLKMLEFGEKGELLLRGLGLMRGYLNQDKASCFRKIQNIWWYPTGDIVQVLPNDNVIFIGRMDSQVKIRGHRVELGEIEATILKIKEISHCVVIWKSEEQQLIAFCLTTEKLEDEIINECAKKLPYFMVPNKVKCMSEFPLTANSKIDMACLLSCNINNKSRNSFSPSHPTPTITSAAAYNSFENNCCIQFKPNNTVLSRKTIASTLRGVWIKVLQFEEFSSSDHFFLVGGNSMVLLRLRHELNKEFRINLTITRLLKNLVFDEMVNLLCDYSNTNSDVTVIHRSLTGTHTLVFIHSLYGGSSTYSNVIHSLKIFGNLTMLAIENNLTVGKPSNYQSLQNLAVKYAQGLKQYVDENVVLIGASFGGTLAFEISRYLDVTCKVIAIDSGTDYGSIQRITYFEHSKEVLKTLYSYDMDEMTKQWILSDSWNMLQLLKDYTPLKSKNISNMYLLSTDGSDLGWTKYIPVRVTKIFGNHSTMLSSEHSYKLAETIFEIINQ